MDAPPANPHLAAALAAAAGSIPPARVDAVWLFPARQVGPRESGLAVLAVHPQDDAAKATRTIYTLRYDAEPRTRGATARSDELAEQGTVPLDRVDRIIEGVLRRMEVPETPDVRDVGGDAEAWSALLEALGGAPASAPRADAAAAVDAAPAASDEVVVRAATEDDIPAMHAVRVAVRENRLGDPGMVTPEDYRRLIGPDGRGWVAEADGRVAGFAVGDRTRDKVWALFVDPACEGRGIGRRLHDAMMDWFFASGAETVWLSTDPGTRAEAFYRAAGWEAAGEHRGEARYEMRRARWLARAGG